MVQIGPIKYNKEESVVLGRSFLLGIFLGIPLGIFINYLFGFPSIPAKAPEGFIGWTITFILIFLSFSTALYAVTAVFLGLFLKKRRMLNPKRFLKVLWPPIVFFIILPIYVSIAYSATISLQNALNTMTGVRWTHTISTILATPFVILFLAIFIPDSRPGAVLYRFIRQLKKSSK